MMPIFVSYYTLGTGYEQEVKNLIQSCETLGLQTDIVGIPCQGKWDRNCCYKPRFLLEKLCTHQQPIVWIDADAIVLKKPTLFETLTCDIALRTYDHLPFEHPSKVITGILYLQDTSKTHHLLKLWDAKCQKTLNEETQTVWDQTLLKWTLLKNPDITIFPLPETYCAIYDKTPSPKEDIVILQYQASRLLKKVIDKEVNPFWDEKMFTQEARKKFFNE